MTTIPDTLAGLAVPVESLVPYGRNPRRGNVEVIRESLEHHGQYRPIVVRSGTNEVLAGNHTLAAAKELGWSEIAATFVDATDEQAARIVLVDNKAADLGSYDSDVLTGLLAELAETEIGLIGTGFDARDLMADQIEPASVPDGDSEYTRRTDSVQYNPTGERPPVSALLNRTKTDMLLAEIAGAELPGDVREFLVAGAQRHLVFNYAQIAEFYAHAAPEVQRLFEASALVIIDYDDAAQYGFVRLSTRLASILKSDLQVRAEEDALTGRPNPNA